MVIIFLHVQTKLILPDNNRDRKQIHTPHVSDYSVVVRHLSHRNHSIKYWREKKAVTIIIIIPGPSKLSIIIPSRRRIE